MKFINDDRGVSEVIGAILVFGILIALLSILQTQAIPIANEKVEFNHNAEVQSDMVEFHEASTRVGATGDAQSTQLQMGTTYPARLLFFNPKNPTGKISVVGDQTGTIENARAVDNNVDDYMDGTPVTGLRMKRVVYEPNYNEYRSPPRTVVEYGAVYNDFGNQTLFENKPQIISGNTISLTFYNGNMSRSKGGATSLESQATSAPSRKVTIQNSSSGPIVLQLPTNLDVSEWEDAVSDEPNVEAVRSIAGGDMVEIELDSSKTYTLKMAQIGIGSGVPDPDAKYMARSSNRQLQIGESTSLPVEVRDRYNNPVSGVPIEIKVDAGTFPNSNSPNKQYIETVTDENGQPAAQYIAGGNRGVVEVKASFENDPRNLPFRDDEKENIRTNITFDPGLDNEDPTIDNLDVVEETFAVCTAFQDITVVATTITGCLTTSQASQITADYEVKDTGGSGLDHIEIGVIDSGGNVILNTTHSLNGGQSQGTLATPQIIHNVLAEPVEVIIEVFDRNGNTVARTESL